MFNFVKIILATNVTDVFSNLIYNFNNVTNLDINKNVNSNIEYYTVNDNVNNVKNIKNLNNINNVNNLSNNVVEITNNVTDTLVKVINSNLSKFESNYSIVKSTGNVNSNGDIEDNMSNSNILTGLIVGVLICVFLCAFVRLCSVSSCFLCLKNSLKCIIYIPRKLCSLCFPNKVDDEDSRDEYNIVN